MNSLRLKRTKRGIIVSALILIMLMLFSISFGTAQIDLAQTVRILLSPLTKEEVKASSAYIIFQIRIPRVLTAVLVGMALASSGVIFQSLFRNPMAEPFLLGVSSGAAFGVALGAFVGIFALFPGPWSVPACAFFGAIGASLVIYLLSGGMRASTVSLLLSGVAMNFLLSSLMSLLMYFNREQLEDIVFWTMGSFSSATWLKVLYIAPVLILGLLTLPFFTKELDLMLLGEESAKAMGLNIRRMRIILLLLSTLLTALAVSISGTIGFVGLVTPHVVRIVAGPSHRRLLPLSIICGGIFLLIADTISRGVLPYSEIPVGIITSLTGAPYFIYLLRKQRREFF